jgi:hypothetical protein
MKIKLYILFLFLSTSLFAQKVTTSIDSTKKKIGAEFKLTLKTEVDTTSKVVFPNVKNIGNLEVINSYKIDTIKNGGRYELIKKYGLTQFDSGKYAIPRLPIIINGKTIYSDSLQLEINDVKVDTLKQKMYDIKDIAPAESESNWWKYLLVIIMVSGIGYLIYWFVKIRKPEIKPIEIVYKTPIEKATSLLQILEKKELWQKGEIKSYYSELTDIARIYIEEEIHIPAMESTTSELIIALRNVAKQKKLKLSRETLENLEKVLKHADLVKFAKSQPMDFEIEEDKKRISNSIVTIHKSIPTIVEKDNELDIWNQQQIENARIEKLKKEKRNKIFKIIGITIFLLLSALIILIAAKGLDYVKDAIFGNPTKELVEGDWIYSEYGNPGVKIETPKVLSRIDASATLPKQTAAFIKEMQTFVYGSITDNFNIMVSTMKFKKTDEKVDLDKTIDESLKIFESQGANNIIVKSESFDTQKGISGKKAYGTLSVLNLAKSKSAKMYYELLVFSQDNGIQKIVIMYPEEDVFGKQIANRVLNSVELKSAQ